MAMVRRMSKLLVSLCFLSFILIAPYNSHSGPLPKSTQKMLKALKLGPSIVAKIEKEVEVPEGWIEKAKKEGKLKILGSGFNPSLVKAAQSPFRERYPFINIEYSSPGHNIRSVKTLVAYKAGRFITDIVSGVGGSFYQFKEADALQDLRDIPNWKMVPNGAKDPAGLWVGVETLHWCMAYNTRLVKKSDLPKKWEDLFSNPIWRNGNLALANRPQLWATQLWAAKGEKWTKAFLTKLFADLKPQLRKEDMRALLQLSAAGEFHAIIPEADTMTYKAALTGAPLGFTCPEPVPVSVEEAIILKGAPNTYAAKLFLNWQLSTEGQLSYYNSLKYTPVHKDLQQIEFILFADQVLGKQVSYREPGMELEIIPKLLAFWTNLWLRRR